MSGATAPASARDRRGITAFRGTQFHQPAATGDQASGPARPGEVDQAQLALQRQRFALFTTVRQGYFEVLADRRRFVVLDELVGLATESYEKAKKSLEAKEIAELDLLQFQVELDRFRAQRDAARREEAACGQHRGA